RGAQPAEQRVQQLLDGGLADRAEPDGAQRDAQLRAGQEHRQLAGRAQRRPGRRAGGGGFLEPVAAGRDERELDRHEERRQRDQQRGDAERDGGAHAATTASLPASAQASRTFAGTRRSTASTRISSVRGGSPSSSGAASASMSRTRSPGSGSRCSSWITRPPIVW